MGSKRKRKVKKCLPQLGGFVRVVLTKLTQEEIDRWTNPKALVPITSTSTENQDGSDSDDGPTVLRRKRKQISYISSSDSSSSESSDGESIASSSRRKSRFPSKHRKKEDSQDDWIITWDKRVQPLRTAKRIPVIIDSDSDDTSSNSTVLTSPVRDIIPEKPCQAEPESSLNIVSTVENLTSPSPGIKEVDKNANKVPDPTSSKVPSNVVVSLDLNEEICNFIDISPSCSEPSPNPVPSIITEAEAKDINALDKFVVVNKNEINVGKIRLRSLQSLGASDSFIKEAKLNQATAASSKHQHNREGSSPLDKIQEPTSTPEQRSWIKCVFLNYITPSVEHSLEQIAVKLSAKLDLTETFNRVLHDFCNQSQPGDIVNEELEDIVKKRQECDSYIAKAFMMILNNFAEKISQRKEISALPALLIVNFLSILNSFLKLTRNVYERSSLFKNLILVFTESLRNGGFDNEKIVTFLLSNRFQNSCYGVIQMISESTPSTGKLYEMLIPLTQQGGKPVPVRNISFKMVGEKMVIEYSKTLEEVEIVDPPGSAPGNPQYLESAPPTGATPTMSTQYSSNNNQNAEISKSVIVSTKNRNKSPIDRNHGQQKKVAETQGQRNRVAETQGQRNRVAETQGQGIRVAETQGQRIRVAETQGQRIRVAETQGQRIRVAETQGLRNSMLEAQSYHASRAKTDQGLVSSETVKNSLSVAMRKLASKNISVVPLQNNQTSVICTSNSPSSSQSKTSRASSESLSSQATSSVNPVRRNPSNASTLGTASPSKRGVSNTAKKISNKASNVGGSNCPQWTAASKLQQSRSSPSNVGAPTLSQAGSNLLLQKDSSRSLNVGILHSPQIGSVRPPFPRYQGISSSEIQPITLESLLTSSPSNPPRMRPASPSSTYSPSQMRSANPSTIQHMRLTAPSVSFNSLNGGALHPSQMGPQPRVVQTQRNESNSLNNGGTNSSDLRLFAPVTSAASSIDSNQRYDSISSSFRSRNSAQSRSSNSRAPVQVVHPIVQSSQASNQLAPKSSPNKITQSNVTCVDTMNGSNTYDSKQLSLCALPESDAENTGSLRRNDSLSYPPILVDSNWNAVESSFQKVTTINSTQVTQTSSIQKRVVSHQVLNDIADNNYGVSSMIVRQPQPPVGFPVVQPNDFYQNQQNQFSSQNFMPSVALASSNPYSNVNNGNSSNSNSRHQYQSLQNNAPDNTAKQQQHNNFGLVQGYENDPSITNNSFRNDALNNRPLLYSNSAESNPALVCEPAPNMANQSILSTYLDFPQSGSYQPMMPDFGNQLQSTEPNQMGIQSASSNQSFNLSVIQPSPVNHQFASSQSNVFCQYTSASTIYSTIQDVNVVHPAVPNQIHYQNYHPNS